MLASSEIVRAISSDISKDPRCARSLFARLVRISACRDAYRDTYTYALQAEYPESEVDHTLRAIHRGVFQNWRQLTLHQQLADIGDLMAYEDAVASPVRQWIQSEWAQCLVPLSSEEVERRLFTYDLRVVAASAESTGAFGKIDRRVMKVMELVGRRPLHASLKELAEQLQITERYLGQMFINDVGLTFHNYLRVIRLRTASELLLKSSRSVKELATEVGYSESSNFCHDFRMLFQRTPKEYRSAMRDHVPEVLILDVQKTGDADHLVAGYP